MENVIGVIGGSGLYNLNDITDLHEEKVTTPFGETSSVPMVGKFGETKVVFIPRHGKTHSLTPSQINYRANIYAMKKLGVRWILSISAVGSLKEEIVPGHMVVIDQFIDRTKDRPSTFFGEGVVGHVSFGDPICPILADSIEEGCKAAGVPYHRGGTYVCMEGPQFSTRAESNMYRSFGASVIGMTNLPEAKLAREAEISYATLAMATDYDCWREEEEAVTGHSVVEVLMKNVENSKKVFLEILKRVPTKTAPDHSALATAIVTDRLESLDQTIKDKYNVLFGKYF
jgi:5'-methylthioadenosine phosphorylase